MAKDHIEAVTRTLRFGHPEFIPRGELFVNKDFLDRFFPGGNGRLRQLGSACRAMGISLVGLELNEGGHCFPPSALETKELDGLFVTGYINGPISRLIDRDGFANAMIGMRKRPEDLSAVADDFLRYVEARATEARMQGLSAIALADDIAGSNGLLFSFDYFVDRVCPIYEAAARIIKDRGLFTFFHSDGNMRRAIEFLIRAGYDCIHPIDVLGGLDLYSLKEEFGERVAFMGHMDVMAWGAERVVEETGRAEREFRKGGLILGSMGGLSVDAKDEALRALYPGMAD
jgi:hypothetical protein